MKLDGGIRVELIRSARGVEDVSIRSDRPVHITRSFIGRTPRQLLEALPMLFSVCGMSQSTAAAQACRAALGESIDPAVGLGQEMLVAAEMLREHAMRITLDWPRRVGRAPCWEAAKPINALAQVLTQQWFQGQHPFLATRVNPGVHVDAARHVAAMNDHLGRHLFDEPPEDFLTRTTLHALREWAAQTDMPAGCLLDDVVRRGWPRAGCSTVPFLPAETELVLADRLLGSEGEEFAAEPVWNGKPAETSALSRQRHHPLVQDLSRRYGSGLLTRLAARLVELAGLPSHMTALCREMESGPVGADAPPPCDAGYGFAQVETARGRLIHAVRLARDKLLRFRILAPTEWNFHPQGVVAQGLKTLAPASESDMDAQARMVIEAIDPCTAYELTIRHA
jgi:hypothetical protein